MNRHIQPKHKIQDWRDFADGLAYLKTTEGSAHFLQNVFSFLNSFVTVDSCAVFKISLDKTSGAEHLCTFGDLEDALAGFLADNYIKSGFLTDPMVQTALPNRNKVRHLARTQYSEAYRSRFFEKAGLIDKVTSLHISSRALFSTNFYRVEASGKFASNELKNLERLGPIISQYVVRHVNLVSGAKDFDGNALVNKVEMLVTDNTQVFAKLSVRERQVCKQLLLGLSEKEIAGDIQVSASTIVTYRQRLYAKLGVATKEELFQLALVSIA